MLTVGLKLGLLIFIVILLDVLTLPLLSVALHVNRYVPAGTDVQTVVYGLVKSVAIKVAPA